MEKGIDAYSELVLKINFSKKGRAKNHGFILDFYNGKEKVDYVIYKHHAF